MVTLADISRVNPFRSVQGSQPLIRHIGVVWVTLGSRDGWLMWPTISNEHIDMGIHVPCMFREVS